MENHVIQHNTHPYKMFVYGTLMSGQPRNSVLAGCYYLGPKKTWPAYSLHELVGADFPALCEDGVAAVLGELWLVSAYVVEALDRIEGHPNFYKRSQIRLSDDTQAEAYLLPVEVLKSVKTRKITSGSWVQHLTNPHRVLLDHAYSRQELALLQDLLSYARATCALDDSDKGFVLDLEDKIERTIKQHFPD